MRSNSAARSNASEMWRYSATLGSTAESSSYPLSTTACRRARVTESLLANNVTSQPRATSPSVMLLATVSQAPYCRGGVRQATGDRTATLLFGIVILIFLMHSSQHLIKWDGSETGGVIGQTIGNDQLAVVEESATRINDVGHVAFPFALVGFEQGFTEAADHFSKIIAIEEEPPMQYFRIGPTPWLRTSHPASVSMGDPQFPSWTSSHGKVGLRSRLRSFQKWTLSENMR